MPKKKAVAAPRESTKDVEEGFRGGLPLPLDRVTDKGEKLRDALSSHLKAVFEQERQNQKALEEKIDKWQKIYYGVKPPKSWPWPDCSNVSVPVTKSSVDTIFCRIHDAVFNKAKLWIVRARKAEYIELAKQVEDALDWFQRNILKLKDKTKSPLLQGIKMGTGIGKNVYERRRRTTYRIATDAELQDQTIHKYPVAGTSEKAVKWVQTVYDGPNFYPVSREDFIVSSDATDIDSAYLCGHRLYMRRAQLDAKVKQGMYDKKAVDQLTSPQQYDEVKEGRAAADNKQIIQTDYTGPYEVWELWTRYDVDDDGEEDEVMVIFHPATGQILRGIYTPLFSGARPYTKFIFYPKEFSFDGEGIVQTLEHLQETMDTMVNQMIDRVTMINCPITFIRNSGQADIDNMTTLRPGGVYHIDDNPADAIFQLHFSDQTISLANEIGWILSMMDRAVGITPISLGISTAERPVAKDTFAQQEETNKKFKYGTENLRDCLAEEGYKLLEMLAQYQPTFKYGADENGQENTKTVQFPVEYIRDAFEIELSASSELLNQEVRREIYIAVYQLMSDFFTKLGSMGQMLTSPQTPPEFKKIILDANDKSVLIMNKILEQFPDLKDSDNLVLDLRKSYNEGTAIMQAAQVMAQQMMAAQAKAAGQAGGLPGETGQEPPPAGPEMAEGPPPEEQPMVGPEAMLMGGGPNV